MTSNKFFHILILLFVVLLSAGCDVHEFPEAPEEPQPEPEPTRLVIHLNHNLDMPIYQSIVRSSRATPNDTYDVRHIVCIYAVDESAQTKASSRAKPITIVTTHSESDGNIDGREITVDVPAGKFDIYAWTDHLSQSTGKPFYNADDFAAINLAEEHQGCEIHRQGFRGYTQAAVEEEKTIHCTVAMDRPMARFRFIATDIQEFAETQVRLAATRSGDVDPDDYKVVFRYTAYMPSVYNMFIDHPTNSRTGVSFEGQMQWINEEEMELGHDFVLTNGSSTSVDVSVEVYNKEGTLLVRSSSVNVPLLRGHLTEVRGKFLTASTGGGTIIDPEFDGSFNIEIK